MGLTCQINPLPSLLNTCSTSRFDRYQRNLGPAPAVSTPPAPPPSYSQAAAATSQPPPTTASQRTITAPQAASLGRSADIEELLSLNVGPEPTYTDPTAVEPTYADPAQLQPDRGMLLGVGRNRSVLDCWLNARNSILQLTSSKPQL